MMTITKLPIIYNKYKFIRQLQSKYVNSKKNICITYCENKEIHKKKVS